MTAASGLGDVDRQRTHPLTVGHDPQCRHDGPQVGGDRGLEGEQLDRALLGLGPQVVEGDVHGDDALGQAQVRVEQRGAGPLHRLDREVAHPRADLGEVGKLSLVALAHVFDNRPAGGTWRHRSVNDA